MQESIAADIETMQQYYQQDRYRAFSRPVDPGERVGSAWLIHGFLGTPADMHGLADLTQSMGFHSEGPLVPGMAGEIDSLGSMTAGHWRATAMAEWNRFAAAYDGPRVLVGYSMGGALALHLAAKATVRPDLLILLAPFTRIGDWRGNALPVAKHVVRTLNFFGDADLSEATTRDWFARAMPELDIDDPRVQKAILKDYMVPTGALDELRKLADSVRRPMRRITIPTVIVQGHHDTVVLPRDSYALATVLPSMLEYHEIRADHMLPYTGFSWWTDVRSLVERAIRQHVLRSSADDPIDASRWGSR
ncbi:MAG: alpha/beta fold hydrolase [Thermomicrobiales bacterium]